MEVAMEKRTRMEVTEEDERLEVVVEDMMAVSYGGRCRCLDRTPVANAFFSCI